MTIIKRHRYDYFIIWGNGLKFRSEIIDMLRKKSDLAILKILNHKPKNIKKFVRVIYSYDYAPFQHLKGKTKYLMSSEPEIVLIFVKNSNVREIYAGDGQFRHLECEYIKRIKEELRDRFNERKDDRRTENHVVHASDNESQTDYILKYLGFEEGVGLFKNVPNPLLSFPYHINRFHRFVLKYVNARQVYCNILEGTNESFSTKLVPIEETPHYLCLTGDITSYQDYLDTFGEVLLTDDYSVQKFVSLSKVFYYLKAPFSNSYVLTREFELDYYQVLDGVHRASILKHHGYNSFIAAVMK
jgi:hypothetical protein